MMNQINLEEVLLLGARVLADAGIEDAALDAWYLFESCIHMDRAQYFMHFKDQITEGQYKDYHALLKMRADRVPLQYILGTQEFMGLDFIVTPDVLVPRQDTEVLVEEIIKSAEGKRILDLCTGSGCIIISLAALCTLEAAAGADISEPALDVCRMNGEKHKTSVSWIHSNLFEKIAGVYDIIVSNPPYIPSGDILDLMPEVRDYEPRVALDGKEDGLYFYRRIIEGAPLHLDPSGELYLEIGCGQAGQVMQLLESAGFLKMQVVKDLSGLDRVVKASKSY